jgi:enoyl-CoA hydratase
VADAVMTEREGRVLTIRLNNPPRNFMTAAMVQELDELTRSLQGDRSIGSVVITGAVDGFFIAHYDVEEIALGSAESARPISLRVASGALRAVSAASRIPGLRAALERSQVAPLVEFWRSHELMLRMNRMDKVFVAAINGTALGAGCETALACDVRLMTDREDARIGQPEMTLGLIPGAGGTQRLVRMLGPSRALQLILDAEPLAPAAALEVGLVHGVVPGERLLEEARATAERYARRSPTSVAAVKRAVYEAASRPHADGLEFERAGFISAASTPAAMRAMEIYVEDLAQARDHPMPWADDEFAEPWRQGTKVDITA